MGGHDADVESTAASEGSFGGASGCKEAKQAAVVRTTASKAAIVTVARAKMAMKLIGPKSAAVAGSDPNALMIGDAAAEKEERGSNSNRGSVDAGIAVAFDKRAREQLDAAFQRKREEIDAAALAKKKRKLEEKKEETAAVSDREEKKDEAGGSSRSRLEKKTEQ